MSLDGEIELGWWGPETAPAPASIVWCAFPEHTDLGKPGPKPRPALVFAVRYAQEPPDNRLMVQVAYGTSNLKSATRPWDFTIANYTTRMMLRLPQATRFDLDNVLWLPWARPFFVARQDGRGATPVQSVLPKNVQIELAWLMKVRESMGKNAHFGRRGDGG